jgi:hypothetical protein
MDEFLDSLSKRLAGAVSRRDALRIASQSVFAVFATSTGITKLWAAGTSKSGGTINTSACGAVQQSIQLAVVNMNDSSQELIAEEAEEPPIGTAKQQNRELKREDRLLRRYFHRAKKLARAAKESKLIDEDCESCIVSQFQALVPVAQQYACGPVTPARVACDISNPTSKQLQSATVIGLVAAPNAFSDPTQWVIFLPLVQNMLGCTFLTGGPTQLTGTIAASGTNVSGNTSSTHSDVRALTATSAAAPAVNTTTCRTPNVNYCGPGSSLDSGGGAAIFLPTVDSCLNEACFAHDSCYESSCVSGDCVFAAEQAACDDPLIAICQTSCGTKTIETALVCGIVSCLSGLSTGNQLLDPICSIQHTTRSNSAACSNPPPCDHASCPGVAACGTVCCPCGFTCVDQECLGVCPSGGFQCGETCCTTGQTCIEGVCFECPQGQQGCGSQCCAANETCSNNQCVPTCPQGLISCETTCCASTQTCADGACISLNMCTPTSCSNGQVCCTNFLGEPGCGQVGGICCTATGNVCPTGTFCCDVLTGPTSSHLECCQPNDSCYYPMAFGGASGCCPPGFQGCSLPAGGESTNVWCCLAGHCGSTFQVCTP